MRHIASFIPIYVTLTILFVAAVFDLGTERIPNWWIAVGLASGVLSRVFSLTDFGWRGFLAGLAVAFFIGWIPFRMRGLGAGDVKIMMVMGCLNGGRVALCCIFISFLLAAGFSLGRLLSLGHFKQSLRNIFQYFQMTFVRGRIDTYPGRYDRGHTMHFSLMVFFGYVAWLGVSICRIIA